MRLVGRRVCVISGERVERLTKIEKAKTLLEQVISGERVESKVVAVSIMNNYYRDLRRES